MNKLYFELCQSEVPPNPPTISAVVDAGYPYISWGSVTGATGYNIYRGTSSGSETLYQSDVGGTNYTDLSVTYGDTYYYTVTILQGALESIQSNEAEAIPIATPTLAATPGNNQVTLNWDATAGATDYTISSGTSPGGETFLVTTGNVIIYVDSTAINGTKYYYTIYGTNSYGSGAVSNEVNATPSGGGPS